MVTLYGSLRLRRYKNQAETISYLDEKPTQLVRLRNDELHEHVLEYADECTYITSVYV